MKPVCGDSVHWFRYASVLSCILLTGLHHGFEKWKKPFNPILGETWQASLSDGSQMFMEQISHHPPVTAFNLEGPGTLSDRYTAKHLMVHGITRLLKLPYRFLALVISRVV